MKKIFFTIKILIQSKLIKSLKIELLTKFTYKI